MNVETPRRRTEHEYQRDLTVRWARSGVTLPSGQHRLLAWEVMAPSWRINDATLGFGEPAIDFLLARPDDRLVALEVKLRIRTRTEALAAALQVTHRALALAASWEPGKLDEAMRTCWTRGRARDELPVEMPAIPAARPPIGRALCAIEMTDEVRKVVAEVGAMTPLELRDACVAWAERPGAAKKEAGRLLRLLEGPLPSQPPRIDLIEEPWGSAG